MRVGASHAPSFGGGVLSRVRPMRMPRDRPLAISIRSHSRFNEKGTESITTTPAGHAAQSL